MRCLFLVFGIIFFQSVNLARLRRQTQQSGGNTQQTKNKQTRKQKKLGENAELQITNKSQTITTKHHIYIYHIPYLM